MKTSFLSLFPVIIIIIISLSLFSFFLSFSFFLCLPFICDYSIPRSITLTLRIALALWIFISFLFWFLFLVVIIIPQMEGKKKKKKKKKKRKKCFQKKKKWKDGGALEPLWSKLKQTETSWSKTINRNSRPLDARNDDVAILFFFMPAMTHLTLNMESFHSIGLSRHPRIDRGAATTATAAAAALPFSGIWLAESEAAFRRRKPWSKWAASANIHEIEFDCRWLESIGLSLIDPRRNELITAGIDGSEDWWIPLIRK